MLAGGPMKAFYGTREASKCWGDEVTNGMLAAGARQVMVIHMTFVDDGLGYVTTCHGDDFLTCADARGLDEVDRILSERWDTKVLPRIGPPAFGGELAERGPPEQDDQVGTPGL